jgi:Fe2+ or Zn2+ uptake regulation protein
MSNNDNNYFNTTDLQGAELEEAQEKSLFQRDVIFNVFKDNPQDELTPFDVQRKLYKKGYKYPLTSIRARMTTLTKDGLLIRSSVADAIGGYNAKNHTWKLSISGLNSH